MLQAQQEGQQHGDLIIDAEEGGGLLGFLGEGNTRGEEVGVVIIADKTVFCGEGVKEAFGTGG